VSANPPYSFRIQDLLFLGGGREEVDLTESNRLSGTILSMELSKRLLSAGIKEPNASITPEGNGLSCSFGVGSAPSLGTFLD